MSPSVAGSTVYIAPVTSTPAAVASAHAEKQQQYGDAKCYGNDDLHVLVPRRAAVRIGNVDEKQRKLTPTAREERQR